jgi:hypothetical protein
VALMEGTTLTNLPMASSHHRTLVIVWRKSGAGFAGPYFHAFWIETGKILASDEMNAF